MLIYTSGTTGKPKGAIHTHVRLPRRKGAQDMIHCMDVRQGDVMYWMTDMGWMMGPWLIFDHAGCRPPWCSTTARPSSPDVDRLWQTVDELDVTCIWASRRH